MKVSSNTRICTKFGFGTNVHSSTRIGTKVGSGTRTGSNVGSSTRNGTRVKPVWNNPLWKDHSAWKDRIANSEYM